MITCDEFVVREWSIRNIHVAVACTSDAICEYVTVNRPLRQRPRACVPALPSSTTNTAGDSLAAARCQSLVRHVTGPVVLAAEGSTAPSAASLRSTSVVTCVAGAISSSGTPR